MKQLLLLAFVLCGQAHAAWVEDSLSYEIKSSDAKEMANALVLFPSALNWLNAQNLTSDTRVRVKHFEARIATYHWENDTECSVPDPGSVKTVVMSTAQADFYYEAKPAEIWHVDVVDSEPAPCPVLPQPLSPKITRTKK